jgi:hypothetical protein
MITFGRRGCRRVVGLERLSIRQRNLLLPLWAAL